MPLPILDLDDRDYEQLTAEARGLISKYFPQWTDYNASDPGITILELFAYIMDISIYQLNRIPERTLENFARLVGVEPVHRQAINTTLQRALQSLNNEYRAITAQDFASLTMAAYGDKLARTQIVLAGDLVKLAVVPHPDCIWDPQVKQQIYQYLRQRCLIATRVVVEDPLYEDVHIKTVVAAKAMEVPRDELKRTVENAVRDFLCPFTGGGSGTGWEFGRSLYRSELYQLIENIKGTDHIEELFMRKGAEPVFDNENDRKIGEITLSSGTSLFKSKSVIVNIL